MNFLSNIKYLLFDIRYVLAYNISTFIDIPRGAVINMRVAIRE